MNRREFLRSTLRYLTLAGLASMAGVLWDRSRSASSDDCVNPGICSCRGCPVFPRCGLDEALAEKAVTGSQRDAG